MTSFTSSESMKPVQSPTFKSDVAKALRSPRQLTQLLRARRQLIGCKSVSWSVRLRGRVSVENYGRIDIGDRGSVDGRTVRVDLVTWQGGRRTIGAGTYLNYGASYFAQDQVTMVNPRP